MRPHSLFFFFFFNDTATTEIYTLSLHDALPIWFSTAGRVRSQSSTRFLPMVAKVLPLLNVNGRSEEHTSELQSLTNLVCRLLLEKKKNTDKLLTKECSHYYYETNICTL